MNERIRDMASEIQAEILKSEKMRNATRLYYYKWALKEALSAVSSYENFINSWAGTQWFKKHKSEIQSWTDNKNRRYQLNYKVEFPK